jgi:hypothetical protein
MNKFLFDQLEKKVEKFFEGKSDLFVVGANQWLSYGGALTGTAKELSEEEFENLKKLIGEGLLIRWLSDMKNENQFFSKMSLTDREYMQTLHALFAGECYQRLKVRAYTDKIKKCNRKFVYHLNIIRRQQQYYHKRVEKLQAKLSALPLK